MDKNEQLTEDQKIAEFVYSKNFRGFSRFKEDLIQEARIKIWETHKKYNPNISKYITWASDMAKKAMISFLRKQERFQNDVSTFSEIGNDLQLIDILESENDVHGIIQAKIHSILLDVVKTRIAELDAKTQEVLLMYIDRRPYDQIAKCVGLSKSTISGIITNFRDSLKVFKGVA